ncbi:Na+/H+ antiporter [Aquabacter sp. L1I39]|uniref:Na+/H+ antiporter n=1 Tax=Aquabacter sp. L1I39 TaxID=2820278 RepID=UPI001ADD6197|nr:Na+/H+ antiporter [Aquabacter sp. L1I39]QTL04372.1 Na+/H+ antiporter [Aquabacter sp. L1I39]
MATLNLVLILVLAVVASTWLSRLLPFVAPPLVQIALGAAMGHFGVDAVSIDPQLFFVLFLPPLLFVDGWRFSGHELLSRAGPIGSLAIGLVLITVLCVGPALHVLMPNVPLVATLALVAVLSPTDAVAGTSLLKQAPLSRRAARIVEGEALLNDASALICLHYVLVLGSRPAAPGSGMLADLLWMGAGGLASGLCVGVVILLLKNAILARLGETPAIQILISLLFPYAAYHAAVMVGASGILAPVAAGLVMGRWELGGKALPLTRLRRAAIWDTLEFTLNGIIFLLLGEQLPGIVQKVLSDAPHAGPGTGLWLVLYIFAALVALTLVRLAWITALVTWQEGRRPQIGGRRLRWATILAMTFSGVRGAVTLAAALALPLSLPGGAPFPERDLVIALAAGVILASLILANIVLPLLAAPLAEAAVGEEVRQQNAARLRAAQAAIRAVERLMKEETDAASPSIPWQEASAAVLSTYRRQMERLSAPEPDAGASAVRGRAERRLRIAGLHAQRTEIAQMVAEHLIDNETARRLLLELDGQEAWLVE